MEPRTRSTDLSREVHLDKKVRCFVLRGFYFVNLILFIFLFYMYSFFGFFLLIVLYVISEPIIIFYHTFPFLLLHNLRSSGHKHGNIHVLYITLQINQSSACFYY